MTRNDAIVAALFGALTEGVIQVDGRGRVTRINAAGARIVGLAPEEAVGRPLEAVLEASEEWSSDSALAGSRAEVDARVRARTGEQRLVRIRRRRLADGEVLVLEDRTQERKTAHRLAYADRLANGAALAAVRLARVPELISAATALHLDGEAAGPCSEIARRVDDALRLLAEPWSEAPVADVADVVAWVGSFLPVGEVALTVDVPPGLRASLHTGLLQQVVANVVGNALRAAGPGGRVEVRARASGASVEIEVADDGPGPRHPADLVFQPYFSTIPGAQGLGLSVVRDIVLSSGGSVGLVVAEGETRVQLRLPAVPTGPAAEETPGRRVLVVHGDPPIVRLLARILGEMGVEVSGVAGPRAALDRLEAGERYDAVLCDLDLPDLDVVALWRQLVDGDPRLGGRIALLASSAAAVEGVQALLGSPARAVHKPFDPAEVREVVAALLA